MLLVMDSAEVFSCSEGYLPLWQVTWDRIGNFLPGLKDEFFKAQTAVPKPDESVPHPPPPPPPPKIDDTSAIPSGSPPKSASLKQPGSVQSPPTVSVSLNNSRGTSIILQPPSSSSFGHTFTTPILNHLGQQV